MLTEKQREYLMRSAIARASTRRPLPNIRGTMPGPRRLAPAPPRIARRLPAGEAALWLLDGREKAKATAGWRGRRITADQTTRSLSRPRRARVCAEALGHHHRRAALPLAPPRGLGPSRPRPQPQTYIIHPSSRALALAASQARPRNSAGVIVAPVPRGSRMRVTVVTAFLEQPPRTKEPSTELLKWL